MKAIHYSIIKLEFNIDGDGNTYETNPPNKALGMMPDSWKDHFHHNINFYLNSLSKDDLINLIFRNKAKRSWVRNDRIGKSMIYFSSKEKGKSGYMVGDSEELESLVGKGVAAAETIDQMIGGTMLIYGSRSAKWVSHILESFSHAQLNIISRSLGRPVTHKDYKLIRSNLSPASGRPYLMRDQKYGRDKDLAMEDFRFAITNALMKSLSETKEFKDAA